MSKQHHTGVVKLYRSEAGFGFVREDISGRDYFLHETEVIGGGEPQHHDRIEFEIGTDRRGRPCAKNARVVIV